MIDMAGVMTTGGMDPATGRQAVADATVTARLRQAGAVLPGKLVTTEAATFEHHASFRRPKKSLGSGSLDRRVVQRGGGRGGGRRSEEHTSELQSLMRISYAVFCLKKKNTTTPEEHTLCFQRES